MHTTMIKPGIQTVKILVVLAGLAMLQHANAEILTLSFIQLEIGDGWTHSIEKGRSSEMGGLVTIHHPNGNGVLKIQTYRAPVVVDQDRLRNMTNVDASVPLAWENWGAFSGYQHDYSEGSSFFRQWWLVDQTRMIFATYESGDEPKGIEIEEIDRIVNSLAVAGP